MPSGIFGDPSGKIRTFAIISPDNPVGIFGQEEWSKISQLERTSFNKENRKELQQLLSRAEAIKRDGNKAMGYGGFDYVKIKGSYGDKETSYLIFNLTLEDAKIVAKNYTIIQWNEENQLNPKVWINIGKDKNGYIITPPMPDYTKLNRSIK